MGHEQDLEIARSIVDVLAAVLRNDRKRFVYVIAEVLKLVRRKDQEKTK
jgi:nitrate reductase assembly molybdenum cofactor insertion protein NarJ